MQKCVIFIVVFLIIGLGVFIVLNVDVETEYTPEAEVEETELRKTIISLYFKDKNSGGIAKETRMIDSKELLKNPYKTLVELLLTGPENTNYEKIIPDGTDIIDVTNENGCIIINFSKEYIGDDEKLSNARESILRTLTELTEVTDIKILVDGVESII